MLKKPLFFSIFVLLFIGLSDYGYGCHKEGSNDKRVVMIAYLKQSPLS